MKGAGACSVRQQIPQEFRQNCDEHNKLALKALVNRDIIPTYHRISRWESHGLGFQRTTGKLQFAGWIA